MDGSETRVPGRLVDPTPIEPPVLCPEFSHDEEAQAEVIRLENQSCWGLSRAWNMVDTVQLCADISLCGFSSLSLAGVDTSIARSCPVL